MNAVALTQPPLEYVRDALRLMFPISVPLARRLFMIFTAYLDDSGTHDDSTAAVVAGYLSTADRWERFEAEWIDALRDLEIPMFHMSQFASRKGPYESWTDARRAECSPRLRKIINDHIVASVGTTIPTEAWDRIAAPQLPDEQGGPYGMAFWGCVLAVREMMVAGTLPEAEIAYVVESGTNLHGAIDRVFSEMLRHDPGGLNTGAISLSFQPKQRFAPLQAADILAYELWREVPRQLALTNSVQRKRNLDFLAEPPHLWGYFTDAELDKWARTMATWPQPNQPARRSRRKSTHGR